MKKFSDRILADWHSSERLRELLNDFFDDEETPKTITHLHYWLNTDWVTLLKRREINEDYRMLIDSATNACEQWVVGQGFANDRTFAKWYLVNYHSKDKSEEPSKELSINFIQI